MKTDAVGLPDIDRLISILHNRYTNQIRRFIYSEQRQIVVCFQVASLAVKPRGQLDDCPFVVGQGIWREFHSNGCTRVAFGRGRCGLAEVRSEERRVGKAW